MITAELGEDSFSFPGQLHEYASRVTCDPKKNPDFARLFVDAFGIS